MYIPFFIILIVGCLVCDVNIDLNSMSNPEYLMSAMSDLGLCILLALIPVVYMGIRFIFSPYIFVDRKVGAVEAMNMSWSASAPLQGKILLFILLSVLVVFIGCLCFFVGMFVSMITLMYAQAALYRQAFPAGMQEPLIVEDANVVVG